ncbi:MAG: MBL fold metallo-hydrolase [Ruminococcaceae bacterium]|nr:MBL fold metallo-hydrolase [Oscillospiraceae bacterium]
MKLEFLGAAHEVTGSCTLLTVGEHRIVIDCGLEQGRDIYENCDMPVAAGEVDAVLLTHAHIDHAGRIPLLCAHGFRGPIYATAATARLCGIMLMDSAHIQEFEAEWRNRKGKRAGKEVYQPLYTTADAQQALTQFVRSPYHAPREILPGVTVEFFDAGHLLGSASIKITVTEEGKSRTLLFSGDLGNVDRPLIRDPEQPDTADYVVIESTYGNRLHGPHPDYVSQLTSILQETFDRGGNVVIPCFAVGRTQEMLYCLRCIKEAGLVKGHDRFPVYVDSPLAVEATRIYGDESLTPYFDKQTLSLLNEGINPILFDDIRVSVTSDDSRAINADTTPKVILSASGMCEAGRIRHHLKHNLWRPESTVLFVGYQTEGTLGNQLINGAPTVKLFGEEIGVRARIAQMDGISGHADRDRMLQWLGGMNPAPQKVFVNHGQDAVCDEFAEFITEQLGIPAEAPYNGAVYRVGDTVTLEAAGNTRRLTPKAARVSTVYDRLVMVYRRLGQLVEQSRGRANKDLAKFADQMQSLHDRWQ